MNTGLDRVAMRSTGATSSGCEKSAYEFYLDRFLAAMSIDPYHLVRFVDAQLKVYADALQELRSGFKRSHWMWFIFPQFAGLGKSDMSRHYAIGSINEAKAFLRHPLLGARFVECTAAVIVHTSLTLENIFGTEEDALKFRSSMTLFEVVVPDHETIRVALESKCNAERDPQTLALLASSARTREKRSNNASNLPGNPRWATGS